MSRGMSDPIYSAIERHKRAMEDLADAVDHRDATDVDVLAIAEAAKAMLGTTPTTVAGALALLHYVLHHADYMEPIIAGSEVRQASLH